MSQLLEVFVAGRCGQLALELRRKLSATGHQVTALGRPELDLSDPRSVDNALRTIRPDVIVNAAGYTAVDKAEDEPEQAAAINAIGAGRLAAAAARIGIPIVHISTDYVFDGMKKGTYVETDSTSPLGVYGRTKLEGEHRVAELNPRHVILRTSWVFSAHGHNFVKTMLRLGAERTEISVVDDQHGCPTVAADLAGTIAAVLPRITTESEPSTVFGIFHVAGQGPTTWYHFAHAIMEGAARRGASSAMVRPVPTSDYPTRAMRPANSVLDTTKLHSVYGIEMQPWQIGLDACLDEILQQRT